MRVLLLSRLLRKVVIIALKIAVMIMYHSLKFSFELGCVAQYLEVHNVAAKSAGVCTIKCPAGFSSSHPSPCQTIWIYLS